MQAERRAEIETDIRPLLSELCAEAAQVFGDVCAGGEEIREQQDSCRTPCDTALRTLRDRWLREFEVRGLDNSARKAGSQLLGDLEQVSVGGREAAAVSDQQDCGSGSEFGCGRHGSSAKASEPLGANSMIVKLGGVELFSGQSLEFGTKWILPLQSLQATFIPRYLIATRSSSEQWGQSE